ncbi:MAG TPA: GNAT family N-acetyltransferase, partial [Burkholderiaceae bacterium]
SQLLPNVRVLMRLLASGGLTLEPQVAAHAEEMFAVLSDPAIYEYENEPPPSVEWLRERFARLETRRSPDGQEQWLNWVIRLPSSEAIGFVQATLQADGQAVVAYVLSSKHWGKGLAQQAVRVMLAELVDRYDVQMFFAVLKRQNQRSARLLERLSFKTVVDELAAWLQVEQGELLMQRAACAHENKSL